MDEIPKVVQIDWEHQYRIIPSKFPPINFFEDLVDPGLMDEVAFVEGLTNDRLRDEIGEIKLVPDEDRISGSGSNPVMAAFTHIGHPSRFTDGSYGVYYAAASLETAIEETKYHRAIFLSATNEPRCEVDMRVYVGEVVEKLHDVRDLSVYADLHNPSDYTASQAFGREMKLMSSWGIVYRSVRNTGGECAAILRPKAISIPRQGVHLSYVWDGKSIINVYEKRELTY